MIINVKVNTNSSFEKIICLEEDYFEVWIKEKPINNLGNKKIENLFKKYFKKEVKIIFGKKTKKKENRGI